MTVKANAGAAFTEMTDVGTSSEHDTWRFSRQVGAWFLKVQEEATLRMLAPYPGTTILDVSGGYELLTGALIENNFDLTILGTDEERKAHILSYLETHRCTFEVGDLLHLPFPDQSFGVAVSFQLLPHVNHWQRYISELTRVAEKAVLIDFPEVRSLDYSMRQLFQRKKRMEGNSRPYTYFRQEQVLEVFRENDFIQADHFAKFFLPVGFHHMMQLPKLSQLLESLYRRTGLTDSFGSPIIIKVIREQHSA